MKRSSQPPTSVEIVSLPSEKAPAPPQPQVMSQTSQLAQRPVLRAGQARRSMSGPRSTSEHAGAVAAHQLEGGEDAGGAGPYDDHVISGACSVHHCLSRGSSRAERASLNGMIAVRHGPDNREASPGGTGGGDGDGGASRAARCGAGTRRSPRSVPSHSEPVASRRVRSCAAPSGAGRSRGAAESGEGGVMNERVHSQRRSRATGLWGVFLAGLLLLPVVGSLAACGEEAGGAEPAVYTEADDGRTVPAAVGDVDHRSPQREPVDRLRWTLDVSRLGSSCWRRRASSQPSASPDSSARRARVSFTFEVTATGTPVVRRPSTSGPGRPARSSRPRSSC